MTERNLKVTPATITANDLSVAVDRCFGDLVQNIKALRETEHYNTVIAARDALKSTLIKSKEATS